MFKCLCAFFLIAHCLSGPVKPGRVYYPEEEDVNYKRYILVKNSEGEIVPLDLLEGADAEATQKKVKTSDVSYYIYTKSDRENGQIVKNNKIEEVAKSGFDPSKKNVFIVHGWMDRYTAPVNVLVKAALLAKYDVNVFVVDWSPIADDLVYHSSAGAVQEIGNIVGTFINDLQAEYNLNGYDFLLIGHSLGAHVVGNAGKTVRNKIHRIIGLDPAGPLFSISDSRSRLDYTDGLLVEVIHTNGALLGLSSSIGHVDFYPNGGQKQPGCGIDITGSCSHSRSFELLAEAIENQPLVGVLCDSYNGFQKGKCSQNEQYELGNIFEGPESNSGDYFLVTNSNKPYAI